jgi:hypothetical protein
MFVTTYIYQFKTNQKKSRKAVKEKVKRQQLIVHLKEELLVD